MSTAEPTRPAGLDEATIVAWARRTRTRRGLPPKITDQATLRRIVTLAFAHGEVALADRDGDGRASP